MSKPYVQLHGPKITFKDVEIVEFVDIGSKFENGHSILDIEVLVKLKGTMAIWMEFVDDEKAK